MAFDGRGEPLVRPTSVPFRSLREVPLMVRSMTKRGMPKPFAILLAALMALYFVPLGALPAMAAGPSSNIALDLEGCNLQDNGLCKWTDGNLGMNWAELDLVPHRFIVGNKGVGSETFRVIAG